MNNRKLGILKYLEKVRKDTSTTFQVIRFLIVGGLSFVVDFGTLWFLHVTLGVAAGIASILAFLFSFFANFFLQKLFTFQSQKRTRRSLILYILLATFNTFATGIIVGGLTGLFGWVNSKIISVALISIWNFFAYKYLVFVAKAEAKE